MVFNTHIIETGWVEYLNPRIYYPFTSLQFLLPTSRKWVKSIHKAHEPDRTQYQV